MRSRRTKSDSPAAVSAAARGGWGCGCNGQNRGKLRKPWECDGCGQFFHADCDGPSAETRPGGRTVLCRVCVSRRDDARQARDLVPMPADELIIVAAACLFARRPQSSGVSTDAERLWIDGQRHAAYAKLTALKEAFDVDAQRDAAHADQARPDIVAKGVSLAYADLSQRVRAPCGISQLLERLFVAAGCSSDVAIVKATAPDDDTMTPQARAVACIIPSNVRLPSIPLIRCGAPGGCIWRLVAVVDRTVDREWRACLRSGDDHFKERWTLVERDHCSSIGWRTSTTEGTADSTNGRTNIVRQMEANSGRVELLLYVRAGSIDKTLTMLLKHTLCLKEVPAPAALAAQHSSALAALRASAACGEVLQCLDHFATIRLEICTTMRCGCQRAASSRSKQHLHGRQC